jgi:hypothetical protein
VASVKGGAIPGCNAVLLVPISGQQRVVRLAVDLIRLASLVRFSGLVREERLFGFGRFRGNNLWRFGRDNPYGLRRLYGLRRWFLSLLSEKGAPRQRGQEEKKGVKGNTFPILRRVKHAHDLAWCSLKRRAPGLSAPVSLV